MLSFFVCFIGSLLKSVVSATTDDVRSDSPHPENAPKLPESLPDKLIPVIDQLKQVIYLHSDNNNVHLKSNIQKVQWTVHYEHNTSKYKTMKKCKLINININKQCK